MCNMSACPVDEGVAHQQPHGDQQVAGQAQHCQLVQHFGVVGGFEIRAVSVVPTRGEDVDEARHPNGKHFWSILLHFSYLNTIETTFRKK